MSHSGLRTDKHCLNCGTLVQERYCSHCGQENVEPKESLWHLIRHFFEDVTHYDSKFTRFFKYLITRPGYLTQEYLAGHRATNLNPIRAYIFISFVFFLVLFSGKKEEAPQETKEEELALVKQQMAEGLRNAARSHTPLNLYDSTKNAVMEDLARSLTAEDTPIKKEQTIAFGLSQNGIKFTLQDNRYQNVQEYDSVQSTLADTSQDKDKGIMKWIIRTNLRLKDDYGSRRNVMLEENFQHSVPKIMFVLLPLFALYVWLFFSRKKYYYTQHVIFSIHFHSFVFLLLLLMKLVKWIFPNEWFGLILDIITVLILFIYLAIALKNAYKQSFGLSLTKAIGVSLLYLVSLVAAVTLLALFTFLTA
ncbi:DUF3667 domain-containing protein [Paraflavitalea soli]|uniref:DUF3667 domain-containing protein n=1 Tax=Paraflavitalea soli TaxID=2315862 RepID=A0A3B7MFH8_9BACT|nr:DUF3667 domain-containing protein [Paraflavitalea soli]AXY73082.1 DUF3667 domain-containing protein [Paraflavitalea soli]